MADPNEAGGWVIDPKNPNRATYTDETGTVREAFKDAPAAPAPQTPVQDRDSGMGLADVVAGNAPNRGAFQRLKDSFSEAGTHGFPGLVARKWYDWTDYGVKQLREQIPGKDDAWYESKADELIGQAQKGLRDEMARKQEADPNWKPDESFWHAAGEIDKWGPWLAGQVLGSAGPESLVNPGGSAVARVGAQGVMGAASDALYQGLDMLDGVTKDFNVWQTLGSAAAGAGLQGVFEIPSFITGLFKARGIDTTPGVDVHADTNTTPMSGMRLSPEQEAKYADLLNTGTVKEILDFIDTTNGFTVKPSEVAKYVEAREAGILTEKASTNYVKSEAPEGVEAKLASEANDFLKNKEDEIVVRGERPAKPEVQPSAKNKSEATQAAADHVNEVTATWKDSPEFVVHENFDDMPDLDPGAIGVTTPDGKVLINMKNVAEEAHARGVNPKEIVSAVTFHEGLGHTGLTKKFGDELDAILENMYSSSKKFGKDVDDWVARNPDAYADDVNPLARAAEEVLAEMSEGGKISPTLGGRFANWLKEFGRKMGLTLDYSPGEVKTILGMAHNAVVKGGGRDARANGFRYSRSAPDDEADLNRVLGSNYREPMKYGEPAKAGEPHPDDEFLVPPKGGMESGRGMDEREEARYNKKFWRGKAAQEAEGWQEELVNLNTGEAGPKVQMYDDTALKAALAKRNIPAVANGNSRYMKRVSGKGSEGPLQGGSKKEVKASEEDKPYLGLGRVRSNEKIESILAENAPEPTKESWSDWIDEANSVRSLVKAHKKLDGGSTPAEVLAAREGIIKSANRIAKLSRKAADGELNEREQYQLLAEMARNADMQDALAGVRSNAARIVNSFKINVETDASFTDAIRNMMQSSNNTVFNNPANRQKLFQMVHAASNNPIAVNRIVKAAVRSKAEDFIFRVWYNMLLSSPATHGANFLGTGANFVADLLENTGAVVAGHVKGGAFRNIDRVRGREVAYRAWGALQALKTASTWQNARDALNTGQTGGKANSKSGQSSVYTGSNKIAGAASGVLESPTRALAGADEWWRNVLQLSNIYGLAVRNAGNKGLKGKQFWGEVDNLINNPTKEMIDQTNDYTKVLQFLDKPSAIGKSLIELQTPKPDSSVPGRIARGVLRAAVPFVKTPDALIRTAIRRSGVLTPLERENIRGWKAGGAERDKVKARMIMGSTLAFYLATQAYSGNITGQGPADPKKKAEWLGSHQPNSIKVNGQWYSIAGLEPVSTNITGIATLVERMKNGEISSDDYAKSAISLSQGVGSVLTENSYLDGFNNLMETNDSNPAKAKTAIQNFLANMASSVTTPAIVRGYARSEDPAVRDTTGDSSTEDRVVGRVKAGFPGLTDQLPQRYDVYGRAQTKELAGPDIGSRTETRMEESDPVIKELSYLSGTTDKVIVGPPGKGNVKVDGVPRRLSAEEYQKYQHLSGYWIVESMREEMKSPEWKKMSDEDKIETVKEIRDDMRKAARDLLFDPDDEEPNEEDE